MNFMNIQKSFVYTGLIVALLSVSGLVHAEDESVEPLELQKIMLGMGENMREISDGINSEDWKKVEENAVLIADHPQPPMLEKVRILAFMQQTWVISNRWMGKHIMQHVS